LPKPASSRTAASLAHRLTLVLLMSPAAARADAEAFEPVTIDYEATLSCADRGAFLDKIRKRTTRFRETRDSVRRFVVRIGAEGGRFGGHLEVESRGTRTSGSPVEGRTCEEVVEALALSTALAIDPRAPGRHEPAAPPAASPPPTPGPVPVPTPPGPEPEPPPPAPAAWHAEIGAQVVAAGGVAPRVTPAGALFVGLAHRGGATVRLGAVLGAERDASNDLGAATFQWAAARALACPFSWALTSRLRLMPCATAEAGALTVSATGITEPYTRARLWGAAGLSARLSLALGRVVRLELGGDAIVPIWRSRFYFVQPETDLYDVPPVSWRAEGGVTFALQ
jgi:hypothetical protein